MLEGTARVKPREQQQVFDQMAHPISLGADPRQRLGRFDGQVGTGDTLRQFHMTTNDGNWRPQFVAGIGNEPSQSIFARFAFMQRCLDVVKHVVERGGNLPGLSVGLGNGDALRQRDAAGRERAVGHFEGGRCNAVQRPERPANPV